MRQVAHYKGQKIILLYVGILAILSGSLFPNSDVTYTRFLTYPPGLYLLYVSWVVMGWVVVWRLPYFFRAIFRIPALEYDGQMLTVRGWDSHQIPSEDLPNTVASYGKGEAITLRAPNLDKPISIDLRFVWETPATTLIESLTLRPIASFVEMADDQPVMTDEHTRARAQRRALGYFLIGIGLPIAVAFTYPLLPQRRGPLIDFQSLTATDGRVFFIGGLVGIVMAGAGYLILRSARRR